MNVKVKFTGMDDMKVFVNEVIDEIISMLFVYARDNNLIFRYEYNLVDDTVDLYFYNQEHTWVYHNSIDRRDVICRMMM